jgi:hypothetical protein
MFEEFKRLSEDPRGLTQDVISSLMRFVKQIETDEALTIQNLNNPRARNVYSYTRDLFSNSRCGQHR